MKPKASTGIRTALYILGGCVAAIALAAAIFVLTFDINTYKPRIEAAASDATGMKVLINGRMKLALFPGASVSLENLLVQKAGADVASAKKAVLRIDLRPLLKRELRVREVGLYAPEVFITRDRAGRLNFETPGETSAGKEARPGPVAVGRLSVKGGHFLYLDERTGRKAEAGGCDIEIRNLSADRARFLDTLSFDGDLSCGEAEAGGLKIRVVRAVVKAQGGLFEADPIRVDLFGGDGTGRIRRDTTGEIPKYSVDFTLAHFRFEQVLAAYKQKETMRGRLDLKAHMEMEGRDYGGMRRTARGEVNLRGRGLQLDGIDIDRLLERYEKTRGVSLMDIGSFFVVGPLGPLLTKGYDFGSAYEGSLGGKSQIRTLVSDWKIRNGVAEAKDVAFSTSRNRVALKGRLDFVKERFDNMTVAALDEKGCVRYSERIHGRFRHPQVERPGTLETATGPVLGLFEKAEKLLTGGKCEVFYAGFVRQP